MAQIGNLSEFRSAVRQGKYAWPGGYPLHFVCNDGGILCCKCVKVERRNIIESIARKSGDGWRVVGIDVNWEDPHMECEHCGDKIESAYAD